MGEIKDSYSKDMIGKEVTLIGTALNAKGGAVIMLKNEIAIYIEKLFDWDDAGGEFFGKRVIVSGVLQRKKFIPDPVIDENGAISTGAYGDQIVLENASWKLAP